MRTSGFRRRMLDGEVLTGTFQKTPSHEVVEILAMSGLDFVCLDGEHSPFDCARMDVCLAMARALDFPALVRVGSGTPESILQALDSGAVGVVVPHVWSVEKAREIARSGRYGHMGRGYAGSSRWAGYATRPMKDILAQSREETTIIAQIEEPEGVEAAAGIAAVDGIDGLFLGPADLSVAYGKSDLSSKELESALAAVGAATREAGKAYMSYVPDPGKAEEWRRHGMSVFFLASEHSWMLDGARSAVEGMRALKGA